jgi:hypothetical protein
MSKSRNNTGDKVTVLEGILFTIGLLSPIILMHLLGL